LSEIQNIHRLTTAMYQGKLPYPLSTPFWQRVQICYDTNTKKKFKDIYIGAPSAKEALSYSTEESQEWAKASKDLLICVAEESKAKILVDSSKFFSRCYLIHKSNMFDLKVVHLVRDGRAIVNSYARKYSEFSIGFRRWLISSLGALYLRKSVGSTRWLEVKYERLASEPNKSLDEICEFLNITFEPTMMDYRKHPHFGIFGNRMAKRKDERIYLDKSWRQELSLEYRVKFLLLGSWLNFIYGYGLF
jgi:hypothetical protein